MWREREAREMRERQRAAARGWGEESHAVTDGDALGCGGAALRDKFRRLTGQ